MGTFSPALTHSQFLLRLPVLRQLQATAFPEVDGVGKKKRGSRISCQRSVGTHLYTSELNSELWTESEQRHSEATVKTSPRQREEHARGNLKKRMTVREAMMADGRKTLLKVLEVISDRPEPSRLWPNQKALLFIGENPIYGIRTAGRLDGRKRFSST